MSTSEQACLQFPDAHWKPLSLEQTLSLFADAPFRWCIAGGYAVEQFLGVSIRAHSDVDVLVFRADQLAFQDWLGGWCLFAADPPGNLRPWLAGEYLGIGIHDLWGYGIGADAWQLQGMLAEAEGDEWFYRRNPRIRGQRDGLIAVYNGVPCVRIEVQLLFKSKGPRPRDHQDFQAVLPRLSAASKEWLRAALVLLYPDGHPWLASL